MADTVIRIANSFVEDAAVVYSEKLLERIQQTLNMLVANPEIGSQNVRKSLIERYGTGIRKLSISPFVLVYRYQDGTVDVLALIHG